MVYRLQVSGMIITMNKNVIYQKKTEFGLLQVADLEDRRLLLCSHHIESAVYTVPGRENELVFPYMQSFSYAFAARPAIKKTLLIGGGAFSYPRYYLTEYPDCTIDVIEISPDVLAADEQYFGLDQVKNDRMRIIMEDGFSYLQRTEETYDLIINDAFTGGKHEGRDEESCRLIQLHLNSHGIYMVNSASAVKGLYSAEYCNFSNVMKKVFQHTAFLQCEEDRSLFEKQNLLLIGSEDSLL